MAKYLDQTGLSHLKNRWNIDGIRATVDGIKRLASCSTGASTAAKTANITTGTLTTLTSGTIVAVTFAHANTAASPTLNINSTGAYNILVGGTAIANPGLLAGTVLFIFDGTAWNLIGASDIGPATNDYYGGFKTGYTTTSTNRAVQLDANGKAYVEIPAGTVDTWRGIQVNGTDLLGTGIDTGKLNLKSGTNVTVSGSGNDVTISTSAEVNQNAFSNIAVSGQTTVAADSKTDTVTFVGDGVTITTDATNDTVTFSVPAGSDNKTKQTSINTNGNYPVLLKHSANATEETDGVNATNLTSGTAVSINPSTGDLSVVKINGQTVGSTPKFTDTTYSAGTGLSLSGTTFNHSNSITAQGTSAVYPVTIDAQGHITAYGTAKADMTYSEAVAGTNTTGRFISAKVLNDTIANSIGQITGFQFEVVASYADLPAVGSFGTIYLVPKALVGTCSTAASTAAKVATVTGTLTTLDIGTAVTITFDNTNTNANPTLNVNSTGAKSIVVNGVPISSSTAGLLTGTVSFIYNGTTWALVDEIDNAYNEYIWITTGSGTQSIEVSSTATSITWDDLDSYDEYYNDGHGNYATDESIDTLFEINTSATPNYIQTKSAIDTYTEDTPSHSVCSEGDSWYAVDTTNHVIFEVELTDKGSSAAEDILEAKQLIIVNDPSQGKYEVIGTTDINLSRYWSKAELTSLSDTEIDNILDA